MSKLLSELKNRHVFDHRGQEGFESIPFTFMSHQAIWLVRARHIQFFPSGLLFEHNFPRVVNLYMFYRWDEISNIHVNVPGVTHIWCELGLSRQSHSDSLNL